MSAHCRPLDHLDSFCSLLSPHTALFSTPRRGIFCSPMCPETKTKEEAGNPQGVPRLP